MSRLTDSFPARRSDRRVTEHAEVMQLLQLTMQVCGDAPVHKMVQKTMEQLEKAETRENPKLNRNVQTCMSILELAAASAGGMLGRQFGIAQPGEAVLPPDVLERTAEIRRAYPVTRKITPRKLYISDLHFYHESLNRQMDQRGFRDLASMHAAMVSAWNAEVHPADEVFIIGDFSMAGGAETNEIAQALTGKLHLIIGNHDHRFLDDRTFDRSRFEWIQSYAEVRDHGRKVILSHYPMMCYNGQYRTAGEHAVAYMLYGHVHNTYDEELVHRYIRGMKGTLHPYTGKPIPCEMINCFCMFSGYRPQTLDAWIKTDADRRKEMDAKKGSQT